MATITLEFEWPDKRIKGECLDDDSDVNDLLIEALQDVMGDFGVAYVNDVYYAD